MSFAYVDCDGGVYFEPSTQYGVALLISNMARSTLAMSFSAMVSSSLEYRALRDNHLFRKRKITGSVCIYGQVPHIRRMEDEEQKPEMSLSTFLVNL